MDFDVQDCWTGGKRNYQKSKDEDEKEKRRRKNGNLIENQNNMKSNRQKNMKSDKKPRKIIKHIEKLEIWIWT